jgi:hypothetical protein
MTLGRNAQILGVFDCVENRRLLNAAAGMIHLDDWERQHIHRCEVCQGVFYVFVSHQLDEPPLLPSEDARLD